MAHSLPLAMSNTTNLAPNNPLPLRFRFAKRSEDGALDAFPLHMKIARGRTAGPAILGRANKSSHDNDTPMKSFHHLPIHYRELISILPISTRPATQD